MIDRLPPAIPSVPAQLPASRAQTTASFEDWLAASRPHPDRDNDDQELASTPAAVPAEIDGGVAVTLPFDATPGIEQDSRTAADAVTATLEAVDAEPQPIAVFEFHLKRDSGTMEVMSVPWRLAGNDMLSRLSPTPRLLTTAQLLELHGSFGATSAAPPNASTPPFAAIGRPLPLSSDVALPTPVALALAAPTRSASRAVSELGNSMLPASVVEPWLARLLRWFEQQGQDPTVWIRDYRLDDAASQAVVNEVRTLAQEQGWQLERIVVNAREMWRAPIRSYSEEYSSCP